MVKVSVFYPNKPGNHFDMSYYCSKHMPMVQRLLGPALQNVAVDYVVNEDANGFGPNSGKRCFRF